MRIKLDIQSYSMLGSEYVAWFEKSKERVYSTGVETILNHKNARYNHRHVIFYKVCLYPLAYIKTDFLIKHGLIPFSKTYDGRTSTQTTIFVLDSKSTEYVFH